MREYVTKRIQMGETAATITCADEFIGTVTDGIADARALIKNHIRRFPDFRDSMAPLMPDGDVPEIICEMYEAASRAKVGPMASVAGAIAGAGVGAAIEAGADHCIVDNGGDIALILDHTITIGIFSPISLDRIPAIELGPTNGRTIGLCTSSGILGHSISLGRAESATVLSTSPPLSDALATHLGNGCTDRAAMEEILASLSDVPEVLWAMAVVDGHVGMVGNPPKISFGVNALDKITIHSDFPASVLVDQGEIRGAMIR